MKYNQVVESNTADLNHIYVYDVLSPQNVFEYGLKNGYNVGSAENVLKKMFIVDDHLQRVKAEHADEDLQKVMRTVFGLAQAQKPTGS